MYSRVSNFIFILLYIFFQLNGYDTATPKRKNNSTVITSKHSSKNGTIFITTRFGDDGDQTRQACKCTTFYSCALTDYIEVPEKPCPGTDVCCKTETPLIDSDTGTEKNPDDGSSNCQCVRRSECQISSNKKTGAGIIDPKFSSESECVNSDDVCCPSSSIPSPAPVVPQLKCGERKGVLDVRISGSEDSTATNFGEFPWMASIWKTVSEDEFICGASLLSSNIILTAAHCINKESADGLKIRVGDYDIKREIPEERASYQEQSISAIIKHPDFNSQTLVNDLAIIVTTEPFNFEYHVLPICTFLFGSEFAGSSENYNSSKCFATGWGRSSANSDETISAKLKKVDLKVVPFNECQASLRKTRLSEFFELNSSFLCAKGKPGFDTCTGDGGGPLFCPLHSNRHQYVQIGITSWGVSCGTDVPGVYASLEANKDWLTSVYEQYTTTSDSPVNESGSTLND